MNIGIIGSRSFNNYALMEEIINRLRIHYQPLKIISGGANGADSIAEYTASRLGILTEVIKPDFSNGYDVRQYHYRNDKIISMSDKIIAFWDKRSRGTKSVIDKCKALNKDVEVIEF